MQLNCLATPCAALRKRCHCNQSLNSTALGVPFLKASTKTRLCQNSVSLLKAGVILKSTTSAVAFCDALVCCPLPREQSELLLLHVHAIINVAWKNSRADTGVL